MNISLRWLKEYVDIRMSTEELAERLTVSGFEVENIDRPGDRYKNFIIGEVKEVAKHPFADRLSVCRVDVGDEIRQIVCGAPNVSPGQMVIVGLPGAVVPHDQHNPAGSPFTLNQVKIRNVESFGMICSPYELGLGHDKDGIMILPAGAQTGISLAGYLGLQDTIFEVGITPNRPDAMSHIGIAREVAAIFNKKLRLPRYEVRETTNPVKKSLTVKVLNPVDCPRYSARVIRDVKVNPSPKWLSEILTGVGIRPINNIVDITNYVLMELGHPLHAFDYDTISDRTILVRRAKEGERFTTLDHKERTLSTETLMICDPVKALAIAGVMGGENSEINDSTVNVVLESAYFDPRSIRKTSKRFGLGTDASLRFERGADPNITIVALDRAASLISSVCGGEVLAGVVDVYKKKIKPRNVEIRLKRLNDILGTSLKLSKVVAVLAKLSLQPKILQKRDGHLPIVQCIIPTFRPDLLEEIDLIEEVARVYGYNNIPDKAASVVKLQSVLQSPDFTVELREWLVGSGYSEVVTNSMQDVTTAGITGDNFIQIANPISREMAALRTSMLPGLLGVIRHNIYHGSKNLRLFELGNVYRHEEKQGKTNPLETYVEEPRIVIAWSGSAEPEAWDKKPRNFDIFDVKGEIQSMAQKISLDNIKFIPYPTTDPLTQTGLRIEIHGCYAGLIGLVHKKILASFEIEENVYFAELLTEVFSNGRREGGKYNHLPKFPVVERDLALLLDGSIRHEDVVREIHRAGASFLKSVELFDSFSGDQIGKNKKSLAYRLQFMADDHTLTQEEIDRSVQTIIQQVTKTLNATIR
jgi:phenylalanyl-tRNA synthetase beta chain